MEAMEAYEFSLFVLRYWMGELLNRSVESKMLRGMLDADKSSQLAYDRILLPNSDNLCV